MGTPHQMVLTRRYNAANSMEITLVYRSLLILFTVESHSNGHRNDIVFSTFGKVCSPKPTIPIEAESRLDCVRLELDVIWSVQADWIKIDITRAPA